MARTVTALLTSGGEYLGSVGPFPVAIPWWSEVEPVVAHLRGVLGVPVWVLRLVRVDGGEGARDGHVTYHVEAAHRPVRSAKLSRSPVDPVTLTDPDPLRLPWATAAGVRELLGWAVDALAAMDRPVTGLVEGHPAVRRRRGRHPHRRRQAGPGSGTGGAGGRRAADPARAPARRGLLGRRP